MAKVMLVVVCALMGCIVAEPPVGRQYLPPAQRINGANSRSPLSGSYGAPSARYGAPSPFGGSPAVAPGRRYNAPFAANRRFNNFNAISAQYGAPSRLAGAGFNAYNAPALPAGPLAGPSFVPTQYDTPDASSRFGGVRSLSSQYGVPAASSRFGGVGPLSSQYGAPAASSRFGGASPLSSQYGAPVAGRSGLFNTYGAPGDFSRTSGVPAAQYGAPLAGYSAQEDPLAEPANYQFSYAVQDAESGSEFGQEESRQLETAQGSYRVLLPDGRLQVVEYQADEEGYKPEIRYEETELSRSAGGPYPASRALQGPY